MSVSDSGVFDEGMKIHIAHFQRYIRSGLFSIIDTVVLAFTILQASQLGRAFSITFIRCCIFSAFL